MARPACALLHTLDRLFENAGRLADLLDLLLDGGPEYGSTRSLFDGLHYGITCLSFIFLVVQKHLVPTNVTSRLFSVIKSLRWPEVTPIHHALFLFIHIDSFTVQIYVARSQFEYWSEITTDLNRLIGIIITAQKIINLWIPLSIEI
ncbi:MAG: hypothetical protein OXE41_09775 [Gammaproteobacteria bacterium]|nr:hypothetical protein [Gammaproteobacteria bacterium]MCY4275662.1 hypothetical protein [Gammaproteobacteria bacterium]